MGKGKKKLSKLEVQISKEQLVDSGNEINIEEKRILATSMSKFLCKGECPEVIEEVTNSLMEVEDFCGKEIDVQLEKKHKSLLSRVGGLVTSFISSLSPTTKRKKESAPEPETKGLWERYIEYQVFNFVLWFGTSNVSAPIGLLTKKWSFVADLIMTEMMRRGLLVQEYNESAGPGPRPFSTDYYIRTLPPADKLPKYKSSPKKVVKSIFERRDKHEEIEKGNNSCLLWPWFAQWFVEEFFKTGHDFNPDLIKKDKECTSTWSGHQINLSTLYGHNERRTRVLRSGVDGKLKCQLINGEIYPPYWDSLTNQEKEDCPMYFPKNLSSKQKKKIFAIGHPRQNLHIGLVLITTIFLREHNRICDELIIANGKQDDDWLFKHAREILNGLLLKFVCNDYIQHINPSKNLFNFYFKPSLLKNIPEWDSTPENHRIAMEFNLLYRWHALIPDNVVDIKGKKTSTVDTFFNSDYLTSRGTGAVIKAAVAQPCNAFGAFQSPSFLRSVNESGIRQSRDAMKLRPFNEYTKRFGAPELHNFKDFHSNPDVIKELKKSYESVNDIDLYVGLQNQEVQVGIFPPLLTTMVLAHAVHGIFSQRLCQNGDFTEATFDPAGCGYKIFSESSVASMIARNVANMNPEEVSFEVIKH